MDNTCFGYKVAMKDGKVTEMCQYLHFNKCEECRFYKRDWQLKQQKDAATLRNQKLTSGVLKTKYSLFVNGHYEGEFASIKEIDKWLKHSRYGTDEEKGELEVEDIYAFNIVKIRKEDV